MAELTDNADWWNPQSKRPRRTPEQMQDIYNTAMSDLRYAYEQGDWPGVMSAIKADVVMSGGCWLWQRRLTRDGYPTVRLGSRGVAVHRLVLEAKHGAPLGTQAAHHICATPQCVNPEHLQPVTHRENVAEMLARQSYLARIRELEAALMELQPDHPALAVIAVA